MITLASLDPLYAEARVEITTTPEDTKYLWALAKDTWSCMDYFIAPKTGFPYDTDQRSEMTNTTNIGLYLTSLAAATEMGFIPREEAVKKADKILDSLNRLQHWNGFFVNWVSVNGATKTEEGINAVSDFNKLPAGLMITRQEFPELAEKCGGLLNRMNWSIFYNPAAKKFYGGYDVARKVMSPWNMDLLASDTRLASFFVIATGAAPAETWNTLKKDTETNYGLKIFIPSWYGGGIFMQGICGLFLDERETIMGKSTADFAYVQMLYARDISSPVWGWSSSTSPWGDYLGWGGLRGNIVTPHASALAIIYYPNKVVENFKNLEEYGLRAEFDTNGKGYAFGFRDAVDIDSKKVANTYLTALDQGMLFLSLANYLKDGLIWKLFEKDPVVRHGKELLKNYFSPRKDYANIYSTRDRTPFEKARRGSNLNLANLVVDDCATRSEANKLGGKRIFKGCAVSIVKDETDPEHPNFMEINYNLNSANPSYLSEGLLGADISRYNAFSFYLKGDKNSRYTHSFGIELEGENNGAVYKLRGVTDKWQKVIIPLREFGGTNIGFNPNYYYWGGFITDRTKMKKIKFDFELSQISEGKGKIYISDLGFERLDDTAFRQAALSLKNFADSAIWNGGILDDFETKAGWNQSQSQGTSLNFNLAPGKEGSALELNYGLGNDGQARWVAIEKDIYLTLPERYTFKFFVKSEGGANVLEFKLIDTNASTFGKKLVIPSTSGEWKEIILESSNISYLWGGDTKLDRIRKISLAISTKSGGKGRVSIDKLMLLRQPTLM